MCNSLLGCAVADALGMPFERKLPTDTLLINWDGRTFLPSVSHKLKAGQFTDDTEMSIMVAESLITNNGFNPDDLSRRYINWIDSGLARGYGRTTFAAINNLRNGIHWSKSGILNSNKNGSAMRAASFGIYFNNDINTLLNCVKIDSNITHVSDNTTAGAQAIALAAAYIVNNDIENLLKKIVSQICDCEVKNKIILANDLAKNNKISISSALTLLGTKTDVRETVPSALYCFIKFNSYIEAVVAAIRAGFDTDTTASIVGALFGAKVGINEIPKYLISQVENNQYIINLDYKLNKL